MFGISNYYIFSPLAYQVDETQKFHEIQGKQKPIGKTQRLECSSFKILIVQGKNTKCRVMDRSEQVVSIFSLQVNQHITGPPLCVCYLSCCSVPWFNISSSNDPPCKQGLNLFGWFPRPSAIKKNVHPKPNHKSECLGCFPLWKQWNSRKDK